jgi:hypothetical protein
VKESVAERVAQPWSPPVRPPALSAGHRRRALATVVLVAGALLFTVGTTYVNWVKYESLRSSYPYDLAYFNNTLSNLAHGRTISYFFVRAWFRSRDYDGQTGRDHDGPSVFRSTHFSPMQSFVIPQIYRFHPDILTLMVVQSLLLATGAFPLYRLVVERTGDVGLGAVVGASYLLHPAVLHLAFNDYRTISLGIPLALFALWFHASRNAVGFGIAGILMLSCRDEYAFLLALFGLINWRAGTPRTDRVRWAVAPLALAGLWAALSQAYYLAAYGIPWPVLAYARDGVPLSQRVFELLGRLPILLRIILLPGALAALVPEMLAVALAFAAIPREVLWPSFPHHDLQHLSPALAVVFWGFAWAVARLRTGSLRGERWGVRLRGLLLAAAALGFAEFGLGAAGTYLVGGHPRYEEITRINDSLPWDATVMVSRALSARFSDHARVLPIEELPLPRGTNLGGAEERALIGELVAASDLVATGPGDEWVSELALGSGRFEAVRSVGQFRLLVARSDAPRPADPDAVLQKALRWDQLSALERRWAEGLAR